MYSRWADEVHFQSLTCLAAKQQVVDHDVHLIALLLLLLLLHACERIQQDRKLDTFSQTD